eukprot:1035488-Alexandrium_andersonii.AAC.1
MGAWWNASDTSVPRKATSSPNASRSSRASETTSRSLGSTIRPPYRTRGLTRDRWKSQMIRRFQVPSGFILEMRARR